jgi:hypothetical protein
MKIALKYGLLITFGAIAWVVIAHLVVPDPRSSVHRLGAGIFFNILNITGIYLAVAKLKNETGGELSFKSGLKTGIATAFVYAVSFCLFFMVAIFAVGSKLMASEPGAENLPLWQIALAAFIGLFFSSLILGLVYSTLISFFLAKRRGVNLV